MLNDKDSTLLLNHLAYQVDLVNQTELATAVEKAEYNLFALLKPKISIDGNQWCVLYGENGVTGFGDTAYKAILDFNKNWHKEAVGKVINFLAGYEEKFIVIHTKNYKYLSENQFENLKDILWTIVRGRQAEGKFSENNYYVCNQDEPYADEVIRIILEGETEKLKAKKL